MENELVVRKADEDDINTIGYLAQVIWPETYADILSPEQIDYMMKLFYSPASLAKQMKKHAFLVAELDEEAVGFASYSITQQPGIYRLHKLYVLTGMKGRGIGSALLRFILEDLQPGNITSLELNVNRYNSARLFYEKLGFEVLREEDIDIGNGFQMNDYVMRLTIKNDFTQ
jgi:ribosomal protein S18 acetylase RimI-like enzyme